VAIGIGYFHYQLLGTTFIPKDGSYEVIKGNGNALMPSLSFAWGRNIPWIKNVDVRYFTKHKLLIETPYGIAFTPHYVLEIGFASSLFKNNNNNL